MANFPLNSEQEADHQPSNEKTISAETHQRERQSLCWQNAQINA